MEYLEKFPMVCLYWVGGFHKTTQIQKFLLTLSSPPSTFFLYSQTYTAYTEYYYCVYWILFRATTKFARNVLLWKLLKSKKPLWSEFTDSLTGFKNPKIELLFWWAVAKWGAELPCSWFIRRCQVTQRAQELASSKPEKALGRENVALCWLHNIFLYMTYQTMNLSFSDITSNKTRQDCLW